MTDRTEELTERWLAPGDRPCVEDDEPGGKA